MMRDICFYDCLSGISVLRLEDGCKLKLVDFVGAAGHSVNMGRQGASHIHSVVVNSNNNEDGKYPNLFACDLGADMVISFSVSAAGKLTGGLNFKNYAAIFRSEI